MIKKSYLTYLFLVFMLNPFYQLTAENFKACPASNDYKVYVCGESSNMPTEQEAFQKAFTDAKKKTALLFKEYVQKLKESNKITVKSEDELELIILSYLSTLLQTGKLIDKQTKAQASDSYDSKVVYEFNRQEFEPASEQLLKDQMLQKIMIKQNDSKLVPDYHQNCPNPNGDRLFFCGFSGDTLSEEEALNKAIEDAKLSGIKYFNQFVQTMTQSKMLLVNANGKEDLKTTLEKTSKIYSSGIIKNVLVLDKRAFEYKANVFKGYAMIEVDRRDFEPSPDTFLRTVSEQGKGNEEALSVRTDIICYNPDTKTTRTLKNGDKIKSGEYVKIIIEVSQPRYLYIFNVDSAGQTFALFPRSDIALENPLIPNKEYQFPEGNQWFHVDNNKGKEITDILLLKNDKNEFLQAARALMSGGSKSAYEKLNLDKIKSKGMGNIVLQENQSVKTPSNDLKAHYSSLKILSFEADWRKRITLSHQ